ncbi:MAG TPA: LuxR C-terminal-related transcriptional regulator, partial [Anaerolineales bacterium]|nr:LuxR C-terminal-related transcriptional regulator [Anaerolineales bacterium]
GYGKTTTIRMWVEKVGYPVAWVSLEKSDNDFKQFITYFLTALQQAEDDLGQAALEVVENVQEINLQQVLGLLVNDLVGLDQLVILVLEDYHLIENEKIDQFIELLLNQNVAKLHLVITTREDPNLPLTRLRVRNQLTEIRAMDLSFSLDEADEFFSNVMGVHLLKSEMEILESRTEGWAAGLQLAALSLKESADKAKFVEAFRGTHRHVLDYLIEEVLKSQTEEIKEFLRRTSILDQLSPSLCEAVIGDHPEGTGQKASGKYLQYLESNNLFLIALDEERTWYRFHALFAELLRNQLLLAEPERVDELHERAADWYIKNGFIQKAVEHAFQVSNLNKAFALIERHTITMLYQGEVHTVVSWFDRLPESLMQNSPMMFVNKAWALALMHYLPRMNEIDQAAKSAERALDLSNADQALRNLVAGHIASIQAYLMQSSVLDGEEPGKLIATSQRAQELLPEDERGIRSVNALNIGYGHMRLGDLSSAEKAYQQVVEDGVAGGNWYAAVYGQMALISMKINKAELKEALQLCEANIERFNRFVAGQRFPPIGELYSMQGGLLLEQNRLAEAEQALLQGLSLAYFTREANARLRCYSSLARLRLAQGDREGVLENVQVLEESWSQFAFYAQALRHRISTREPFANQSNFDAARSWLKQMGRFEDLPDFASVDPVSEIYFHARLNVAHILTRLRARNPKDFSLLEVHNQLARHEKLAEAHGLLGWLIEIWIARALMYQVEGKAEDARSMIQSALSASAPRGYLRIFLDEADLMCPLLESILPRLKDNGVSAFARRLLESMPGKSAQVKTNLVNEELLSDREIEVLRLLATGESYKEIGQKLFLSLNTVQFHVKSIYRKLSVNKRGHAILKAREMKLI